MNSTDRQLISSDLGSKKIESKESYISKFYHYYKSLSIKNNKIEK